MAITNNKKDRDVVAQLIHSAATVDEEAKKKLADEEAKRKLADEEAKRQLKLAAKSVFGLFVEKDEDVVAQLIHSVAAEEEEAATVDKEAKKKLKLAAKKEKAAAKKKLDEWKQHFWSQPQRMRAKRITRGPRYVPKKDDDDENTKDQNKKKGKKKDDDEKTKGDNEDMERKNNYQGGNYRGNYDNRKNRNVNTKPKKEEQIPLSKEQEEERKQGWEVIKRRPTSCSGSSNGDGRTNTNYRGDYRGNQFSNNRDYRQGNNSIAWESVNMRPTSRSGSSNGDGRTNTNYRGDYRGNQFSNNRDYRQDNNNTAPNEIKGTENNRRPTSRGGSSNGDGRTNNTNYRGGYSGNQFSNNGEVQDNNTIAPNEIKGTEKVRRWESVNSRPSSSGEGIIANNNGPNGEVISNRGKQIPLTAEFVRQSLFVTPTYIIKCWPYEEQDHKKKGGAHEEQKEKKKGGVAETQNVKEKRKGGVAEVEKVQEKKNGGAEIQKVKENNRRSNYNAATNQRSKVVPVAVNPVAVPIKVAVQEDPDTSSAKEFPALGALKVKP